MNSALIIGSTSTFSVMVPLAAGIYGFRRLDSSLRALLALFAAAIIVDLFSLWQFLVEGNAHWAHHIYTPLEYAVFMIAFSIWLNDGVLRRAIRVSIPVFVSICIVNMLIDRQLTYLNGFTQSLACAAYVPVSAYLLYSLLQRGTELDLGDPRLWIGSGLLLYGAGGLGYFAFHNLMSGEFTFTIWVFHNVINIIANFLYSVGFVCQYRR